MIWSLLARFLERLVAAPRPVPVRARLPQMPSRRVPRRRTFDA